MVPRRASDPLIHHGRHFGRTVHAMCNVQALFTNGILRMGEEGEVAEELLTSESVQAFPIHSKPVPTYVSATQGQKGVQSVSETLGYGAPPHRAHHGRL